MQVEALLRPMKFNDISAGTFFKVMREKEPFFGLAVVDADGDKASLIFARQGNQPGVPWLSEGAITSDVVAAMPDAVIRPDFDSAVPSPGSQPFGALISTDQGFYIKASAGMGYTATFDLSTGATAKILDAQRAIIIYKSWSVGRVVDSKFERAFSFPLPSSGSSPLNI